MYICAPSSVGLLGLVNRKDRYEEGRSEFGSIVSDRNSLNGEDCQ